MKYTLAVLFFALSAAVNAQEPIAKPLPKSIPAEQPPVLVQPVVQNSAPYCGDSRPGESRLFGFNHWANSPGHRYDPDTLTFWFIPRPRALVAALCP